MVVSLKWKVFINYNYRSVYKQNAQLNIGHTWRVILPPNCVYACLISHNELTSCSQGIGSWYCNKYLEYKSQSVSFLASLQTSNTSIIIVFIILQTHLCAINLNSWVRTFASEVIPATLHAISLKNKNASFQR
jgi:hypothetical protein